jgi:SAM-dependent methyltransferase
LKEKYEALQMNQSQRISMSEQNSCQQDDQNGEEQIKEIKDFLSDKRYDKAEKLIDKACEKWPGENFFQLVKIECLINTKRVPAAVEGIEKLLVENPDNVSVKAAAAAFYRLAKNYKKAYYATLGLPDDVRKSQVIYDIIVNCLSSYQFEEYNEQFELDVLNLIKNPNTGDKVGLAATALLSHKYKLDQSSIDLDLSQISNDPLLHAVLTTVHIQDYKVENVVRLLRKSILFSSLKINEVSDNISPLVAAICLQNFRNEYIHFVDAEEEETLQQLLITVTELKGNDEWKTADIEGLLLLLGMYYKLYDLPIRDKLLSFTIETWPNVLASVAEATLFNIQEEMNWLTKVESIGSISNETSRKVQSQYEENPYPRWHRLFKAKNKLNYFNHQTEQLNHTDKSGFNHEDHVKKPNILVAGSGTGAHPLNIAANFECEVTAIDITRRSIAYAMMMQDKYKLNNVKFFQLDILELEQLNTTFDAAESCGVIHHMLEPEQGLQAIIKVIKPGGTLKLGLYSELARRSFMPIRKLYLESGMVANEKNIRDVRHGILNSSEMLKKYSPLLSLGDFFCTSGCRDLLFHEQEHCFSIPQLQELIKKFRLNFLGFVFTNAIISKNFVELYGQDRLDDLDAWSQFEQKNPDIFIGMYQFVVETPID